MRVGCDFSLHNEPAPLNTPVLISCSFALTPGCALCHLPTQVVNLVLAAGPTHQWYKATFPSYPANRRALVPWLY